MVIKSIKDFMKKKNKEKIVMLTAYDYTTAKILSKTKIDGILVGDSLGMVMLGYNSTLPVSMNDILHHLDAVIRANPPQIVVADMPFMSYEHSKKDAILNAGKLLKHGADAVKLEGGIEVSSKVSSMVDYGIPVMGHIGLTPQRYLEIGGYKIIKDEEKLLEDAKALQDAGAFSIVIENVYADIAKKITESIDIPTICIGAGPYCDGQILVIHDLLGLGDFIPYFAKSYLNLKDSIEKAVNQFSDDVKSSRFPYKENYKSRENS
ncbi:3-methyl-2-oxobutanoate hydroxymethyltransferase [Acidianus sulfidivorans JP7]|uniref:3-methyl-2-oxobutanoate hydroxymethyltransferase n=1 Tax=Acidianus sulfidivorans JP7 TaxID=619593 RepID=A0A2U9IKX6_9CREN|nr:3-methyl-2-oxobutanoate hydroxymethyltransferase [Acidianus sulfidivorans]AWR96645.1 3-methyl-2-oxobutanoate hydroxymethyltransferase [Acidianus sulfidivorans JP7]